MNYYFDAFKKYAIFNGRTGRKEFWMFYLISSIIGVVLFLIDHTTGGKTFTLIYTLALLIPSLAIGVRRLHDTNRSAWWLLIGLLPIFGGIFYIIMMAAEGDAGENK